MAFCDGDNFCWYFGVYREDGAAGIGAGVCRLYGPQCADKYLTKPGGVVVATSILVDGITYQLGATAVCPCGLTGNTDLYRFGGARP